MIPNNGTFYINTNRRSDLLEGEEEDEVPSPPVNNNVCNTILVSAIVLIGGAIATKIYFSRKNRRSIRKTKRR